MLTAERRRSIMQMLQRDGKVLASELSKSFQVSEDTIRRDLRELAEAGMLQRVHGGALPRSPISASFSERQQQATGAKEAMARAALRFIHPGQVIILDGGTTLLHVARQLPRDQRLTVITHSPPIALALIEPEQAEMEVILIGGQMNRHAQVAQGAATVEAYRNIRADLCFLGIRGLHPTIGISTSNLEESYVKRAMMASAAEVVALASAEKLDTAAPYIVGPASMLTRLVTERSAPEETLAPYRVQGIAFIRV